MLRAAAVAAALVCSSAHATAIYEWQQVSGSATLPRTFGSFEITDATQAAGRLRTTIDGRGLVGNPDSPLLRFGFLSMGANLPDTGPGSDRSELFIFDLDLTGGIARGSIDARTSFDILTMASNAAGLFTVSRYASEDAGTGCRPDGTQGGAPICFGATGQWVLSNSGTGGGSGRVPLPGTLPLVALASFGLAATLRQRKA